MANAEAYTSSNSRKSEGIKPKFYALIRWSFVLLLAVYLLALVIALFDALGFQRLVHDHLRDHPRAHRHVLAALAELKREEATKTPSKDDQANDPQAEGPTINYGQLALQLDSMRESLRTLQSINNVEPPANSPDLLVAEYLPAKDRFDEIKGSITKGLEEAGIQADKQTDQTTEETFQCPKVEKDKLKGDNTLITQALEDCENVAKELRRLDAGLKAAASQSLQKVKGKLTTSMNQIRGDLESIEGFNAAYSTLEIRRHLDELKQIGFDVRMDNEATKESLLRYSSELTETEAAAKVNILGEKLQKHIDAVRMQIGSHPNAVAESFGELEDVAVKARDFQPGAEVEYDISPVIQSARSKNDKFQQIRNRLESALLKLNDNFSDNREFSRGLELAPSFTQITAQTEWLKRAEMSNATLGLQSDNLQPVSATYDEALSNISNALARVSKFLTDHSPTGKLQMALNGVPNSGSLANLFDLEFNRLVNHHAILLWGIPIPWFESLFGWTPVLGIDAQIMATMNTTPLAMMLIFIVGAFGSLVYLAQHQLRSVIQEDVDGPSEPYPFSWYIMRPVFGIVVAFGVFLLYKVGEVALGSGTDGGIFDDVNVWILSALALFAGILSWHALDMIQSRGAVWFGQFKRSNLWATGVDKALKDVNQGPDAMALHIGVSPVQVDRWIDCVDKVTPEMQDRISTWLDRDRLALFNDRAPRGSLSQKPMLATGLAKSMAKEKLKLDAAGLADLLGVEVRRVKSWLSLKAKVPPSIQWRMVDVLNERHAILFDLDAQVPTAWAVGLRKQLQSKDLDCKWLAARIQRDERQVRQWMEQDVDVPLDAQAAIADALNVTHHSLFANDCPDERFFAVGLRQALDGKLVKDVANALDAEAERVHAWIELDKPHGQIAPATQRALTAFLGVAVDTSALFRAERPDGAAKANEQFAKLVIDAGGVAVFARAHDLQSERVQRWVDDEELVQYPTQNWLASQFSRRPDELFS